MKEIKSIAKKPHPVWISRRELKADVAGGMTAPVLWPRPLGTDSAACRAYSFVFERNMVTHFMRVAEACHLGSTARQTLKADCSPAH